MGCMSKEPTENISITVSMGLLSILDYFCKEADLTRSQAVNRAIRLYISSKIAKENSFWERIYARFEKEGKI